MDQTEPDDADQQSEQETGHRADPWATLCEGDLRPGRQVPAGISPEVEGASDTGPSIRMSTAKPKAVAIEL
jgi:hypothetical protein